MGLVVNSFLTRLKSIFLDFKVGIFSINPDIGLGGLKSIGTFKIEVTEDTEFNFNKLDEIISIVSNVFSENRFSLGL
jgi:hypothetical protein